MNRWSAVQGTADLASATNSENDPGLRWSERESYCLNIQDVANQPSYDPTVTYLKFDCVFSLNYIYKIFVLLYFLYFALAVYLDNVLANENGVKRPLLYFLQPSYWSPRPQATQRSLAEANKQVRRNALVVHPALESNASHLSRAVANQRAHRTSLLFRKALTSNILSILVIMQVWGYCRIK